MAEIKDNSPISTINTTKPTIKVEEKFPLKDLKANYKAFNYSKEAVDGAFFNCTKKDMTKTEFKKIVESFLKRKVE